MPGQTQGVCNTLTHDWHFRSSCRTPQVPPACAKIKTTLAAGEESNQTPTSRCHSSHTGIAVPWFPTPHPQRRPPRVSRIWSLVVSAIAGSWPWSSIIILTRQTTMSRTGFLDISPRGSSTDHARTVSLQGMMTRIYYCVSSVAIFDWNTCCGWGAPTRQVRSLRTKSSSFVALRIFQIEITALSVELSSGVRCHTHISPSQRQQKHSKAVMWVSLLTKLPYIQGLATRPKLGIVVDQFITTGGHGRRYRTSLDVH